MTDATADFFAGLSRRGIDPWLRDIAATVLFDIADGERTDHWWVGIRDGDIQVSTNGGVAGCIIGTRRAAFDGLASGQLNAMAALLRGEFEVSGDPELLLRLQRFFPGPPRAREGQPAGTGGGGGDEQ